MGKGHGEHDLVAVEAFSTVVLECARSADLTRQTDRECKHV